MSIQAAMGDHLSPLDAWFGRLNRLYDALSPKQRRKVNELLGNREAFRTESYAVEFAEAIRKASGRGNAAYWRESYKLIFPALSPTLQDVASQARIYGLAIAHYNSGVRSNPLNGTRVFYSPKTHSVDYFRGDHLAHCQGVAEVRIFLDGYKAGLARGKRRAK